jgi:hypothetical protein
MAGAVEAQSPCDRSCLEGFADQYLDAVVAHDPARAAILKNAKFTKNGQRLELGDGLWRSITGRGRYRLFVSDPEAGEVAFIGTIREEGRTPGESTPALIALRLKVENRQISEVETLVVRNERAAQNVEKAGAPNHVYLETVPAAERASREDLIKTANMYFSGMQQNDGKGVYPFTDDCNRFENGSQTSTRRRPRGRRDLIPRPRQTTLRNGAARSSSNPACCIS